MSRPGQLLLAAALLVAAVAAAVALGGHHSALVAGSGSVPAPGAQAPAGPTSTAQMAASGPGATEAATQGTSTTSLGPAIRAATATPGTPACTPGGTSAAVTNLGVAAGTEYLQIALTNTSRARCQLAGSLGVAFLDAAGDRIGSPAGLGPGDVIPVVVAPGAQAYALLEIHDANLTTGAGCQATAAAGIGITLPGQAPALTVAENVQVCADPAATGFADVLPLSGRPAQS